MVTGGKILNQTTAMGKRRRGLVEKPIYRVQRTPTNVPDYYKDTAATFSETTEELVAYMEPFVAKRWDEGVTQEFADLLLITTTELKINATDDNEANDQIQYAGIRYFVVDARHFDTRAFDDMYEYALKREEGVIGGPS